MLRKLRSPYQHNRPTKRTNCNTITRFETQHSLLDKIPLNRLCRARSKEEIATVAEIIHAGRGESIRSNPD